MPTKTKSRLWSVLIWVLAVLALYFLSLGQEDTDLIVTYDEVWPEEERVVLLIDLADDLDQAARDAVLAELPESLRLNSIYSEVEGLFRIELSRAEAMALDERLEHDTRIEFAEPEYEFSIFGAPNDPLYQFQWNLEQIDSEGSWNRSCGNDVVVAVIDTGVAYDTDEERGFLKVEDLSRFVDGYDFVDDDIYPFDEHGHGTHVAGTIGQTTNNEYGVASVAPESRIMPVRVLNSSGFGRTADIADAIRFAADNGADVINLSLGGPFPSRIMADAVDYAHQRGVVVVAAAGNANTSRPHYPAGYNHVIAVAATQYDETTTYYSNYGDAIDIAAPGGNTRVDQNDDGQPDGVMQETLKEGRPLEHEFALFMGTSMASPHVAGAAALLVSMGVSHPDRVEEILLETARRDVDAYSEERYGAGLLNASAATEFPLVHYHVPRGLLGVLLAFLMLARGRANSSLRLLSHPISYASAIGAASGLAMVVLPLSWMGVRMDTAAPLASSLFHWPAAFGLDFISTNPLWFSAIPLLALYALLGGARSARLAGFTIGLMFGLSAALIGECIRPLADVAWIPGSGLADQAWLGINGVVAIVLASVAARKEV